MKIVLDKSKFNLLIDAVMFLCMMAIAGLGFLMKFILIPGEERWVKYGRNVELTLLDMNRHEWGKIHLTVGLVLLGTLVLHIILHWKAIVGIYQKLITNQTARRIIATVFIIVSALLLLTAFAVRPRVEELGRGEGRGHHFLQDESSPLDPSGAGPLAETMEYGDVAIVHSDNYDAGESFPGCGGCPIVAPAQAVAEEADSHSHGVQGYMTIGEVAEQENVPLNRLIEHLGLPATPSSQEKLGRLRRQYDFTMSDVERAIHALQKTE